MSPREFLLLNKSETVKTAVLYPTLCTFQFIKSIKVCDSNLTLISPESLQYKKPPFLFRLQI